MARIILGVTGSVAAIRTPELYRQLRAEGHEVRIVATDASLHFFHAEDLERSAEARGPLYTDRDEWGEEPYRRDDPVLHIEFRKWADLLLIAPLDAHTLAKFSLGLSDNFLSCLFRAWDFARPVVLAPAMNSLMWQSPVTLRHLRQLLEDRAVEAPSNRWTLEEADQVFARFVPSIALILPQHKRLACGDIGVGGMAEVAEIVRVVREQLDRATR